MEKAEWIWINREQNADEFAVFHDSFHYGGGELFLELSCAGDYACYVNGRLAAFGQYADYAQYKVFDRVNLKDFVAIGKNVVKIVTWYIGVSCSTYRNAGTGLIYEIGVQGSIAAFSRAGMDCGLCRDYISYRKRLITLQLGFSYAYDTGRSGEYDGTQAVPVQGFGKKLIPRPVEKLILAPMTEAVLTDAQKRIYDLKRECSGILHICFKAKRGARVTVAYGEHLADGEVRYQIDNRNFSVELIANGEWAEFTGTFRRLGARYLQVICESELEIRVIGLHETPYPVKRKPFHSENPSRQKIYDTCVRTLKLCMHEHYEDTPWREQSMYIMDSRNQMLCGYYAFDNPEFARAAIVLMLQGQKENGLFELCFPADVNITIPSFSLMLPTVVNEYVRHTADGSLAAVAFEQLNRMMRFFFARRGGNGLFRTVTEEGIWHFYEWSGELDGAFFSIDGSKKYRNEYDVLINAYFSLACEQMAKLAERLNRLDSAATYRQTRDCLNASIYQTFYNAEIGLFQTSDQKKEYSQLANALCILCRACPADKKADIAEKLAYGYDGWDENTLSMNIFRFDALLSVDAEKYANTVLSEIDKTYSYMLERGATSFWETILGETDFAGAGSLCHGWSAVPVYYYHRLRKVG